MSLGWGHVHSKVAHASLEGISRDLRKCETSNGNIGVLLYIKIVAMINIMQQQMREHHKRMIIMTFI